MGRADQTATSQPAPEMSASWSASKHMLRLLKDMDQEGTGWLGIMYRMLPGRSSWVS